MSQDLEEIVEQIGAFGRFQILLIISVGLSDAMAACGMLFMTLAGATPDWGCPYSDDENTTLLNGTCLADGGLCDNLTFSNEFTSIVSEWNLVCSRHWAAGIVTSVQMAGVTVGSFAVGHVSDKIGRKKALFLAYGFLLVTNFIAAFSVSVEMFTAARFFVGIALGGKLVTSFVVPMEYVGSKYRPLGKIFPFWPCGTMIMSGLAYLIPNWRMLAMTISAIGLPYFLLWCFIPESARWLMVKGRFSESEVILNKIARFNNKPSVDANAMKTLEMNFKNKEEENSVAKQSFTIFNLVTNRIYLGKTALLFLAWFSCGLTYYGLAFGVKNLQGDRYINLILNAAIDIPGGLLPLLVSYKIDRKKTICLFIVPAFIATVGVPILYWTNTDTQELVFAFSLIAKLATVGGWKIIKVFTVEHYPTVVRNIGFASCDVGARIGSVVAPMLIEFHNISPVIPYLTFGATLFITVVCVLVLKETRNQHMEDYMTPVNEDRKGGREDCEQNKELGIYVESKTGLGESRETVTSYM